MLRPPVEPSEMPAVSPCARELVLVEADPLTGFRIYAVVPPPARLTGEGVGVDPP